MRDGTGPACRRGLAAGQAGPGPGLVRAGRGPGGDHAGQQRHGGQCGAGAQGPVVKEPVVKGPVVKGPVVKGPAARAPAAGGRVHQPGRRVLPIPPGLRFGGRGGGEQPGPPAPAGEQVPEHFRPGGVIPGHRPGEAGLVPARLRLVPARLRRAGRVRGRLVIGRREVAGCWPVTGLLMAGFLMAGFLTAGFLIAGRRRVRRHPGISGLRQVSRGRPVNGLRRITGLRGIAGRRQVPGLRRVRGFRGVSGFRRISGVRQRPGAPGAATQRRGHRVPARRADAHHVPLAPSWGS